MFETHVTVVGKLVTGVDQRRLADGAVVANFRVVSTERRFDRAGGGWVDGEKLFLDVACWRRLAENVFASLVKGDAVVVTGRLYTREFEQEGRRRSTVTLEAYSVAADLSWCTAVLSRTARRATATGGTEATPAAHPEVHGGDHRDPVGSPTPSTSTTSEGVSAPADDAPRLVGAAPGADG